MVFFDLLVPLLITIAISFIAGLIIRVWLLKNPLFHMKNQWWKLYITKMMALWGRLFVITLLAGLLFGWIDGIINLPPANSLHILLQTLATIFSGLAVCVFQSFFVGFGFLLIPFDEGEEMMDGRMIMAAQKRILQIAIWTIFSILLLSVLVDWFSRLI